MKLMPTSFLNVKCKNVKTPFNVPQGVRYTLELGVGVIFLGEEQKSGATECDDHHEKAEHEELTTRSLQCVRQHLESS